MDWIEFMSARHLAAEERVGVPHRAVQRAEKAEIEQTKAALRKKGPPVVLQPREPVQPPPEPLVLHKGEIKRGRVA